MTDKPLKPESLAAQALGWIDEATRAITPPIHTSSTYLRDPDNQYRSGRVYARADNPAFDQAEALIARLEQGAQAALKLRLFLESIECHSYGPIRIPASGFGFDEGKKLERILSP